MKYKVCIKVDGSVLEDARTLDSAISIIDEMEIADKDEGQYTTDYYDIKEEDDIGNIKWYSSWGV